MNIRTFIHFLLIAVLGFNPVAANMHIIDHFHDCEDDAAAASTNCETVDHQVHVTADDLHTADGHSDVHSKSSAAD